jgi:hypothetical protein
MVTRSPTSNGCLTKTKIQDWRNSWAVAENSQERARTEDPSDVKTPDAEVEIMETKTRIVMMATMNMKMSSSFETTESRSFKDAVIAFRSRPISTQTASSSSIEMSPFRSLSNMVNAAVASSSLSKAGFKSSERTVSDPSSCTNVLYRRLART